MVCRILISFVSGAGDTIGEELAGKLQAGMNKTNSKRRQNVFRRDMGPPII